MKRTALLLLVLSITQVVSAKNTNDFPLTLHITAIEMEQGNRPVTGSGYTDSNGNYQSSVDGGGTYYWHLFTATIDGDPVTYKLATRAMKGFMKRAAILRVGDYSARWNKNGTLEIQYAKSQGKLDHETFRIQAAFKEPPQDKQ
jgi:hypothetical protein